MSDDFITVESSYVGFTFRHKKSLYKVIRVTKNPDGKNVRVVCVDQKGKLLNICKRQFIRHRHRKMLNLKKIEELNVIF